MKNDKNDFLSKRTKRGVLFLALVCLMIAFAPRVYRYFVPFPEVKLTTQEIAELESKEAQKQEVSKSKKGFDRPEKREYEWQCIAPKSKFDPNTYELADWQKLGLTEKQAKVVLKFSKNGLQSLDDLKKIYVLKPEFIECIQDSLYFPKAKKLDLEKKDSKAASSVNINTASIEKLMSVKGIGDFYAKQIFKLRTDLGGIHAIEQLKDLPYMDESKMNLLASSLIVDSKDLRTININEASVDVLKSHPYISYKVANSIVKMRNQLGSYRQLDEIQKSVLIDAELFQKIKPYISL